MTEWRKITEFDGYDVSSTGEVRSWKNHNKPTKPYILKPDKHESGYLMVRLYHGSPKKNIGMYVHKLVLLAFCGARPEGMEACHFDGNRGNNNISNLRWDTKKSNSEDAVRHGTHPGLQRKGSKHPLSIFNEEQVSHIKRFIIYGLHDKEIADCFSVNKTAIANIRLRNRWPHVEWPEIHNVL